MQRRSHEVGGMCAAAITAAALVGGPHGTALDVGIITVSAIFGSILPDIDHPNSYVSRKNPILAAACNLFMVIGRTITQMILFLCFWISKKRKEAILKGFEHRGVFHTILMVALLYLLIGLIPLDIIPLIQIGICAGYLAHLLMDMLTVSGVRLLYPIITVPFHYPLIRLHTGNKAHEWAARIIFIIATVGILYAMKVNGIW